MGTKDLHYFIRFNLQSIEIYWILLDWNYSFEMQVLKWELLKSFHYNFSLNSNGLPV